MESKVNTTTALGRWPQIHAITQGRKAVEIFQLAERKAAHKGPNGAEWAAYGGEQLHHAKT